MVSLKIVDVGNEGTAPLTKRVTHGVHTALAVSARANRENGDLRTRRVKEQEERNPLRDGGLFERAQPTSYPIKIDKLYR
jgi:hypothetical protein